MRQFDPNLIAAKVLRQAVRRHARAEHAWGLAYRKAWRTARAEARTRPAPRIKIGSRVQYPKLSPEELSKVGDISGLMDDQQG